MEFLRIIATDGTMQYIPDNYVVNVLTSAETYSASTDYSAPKVIRGKITQVKYYDGANATAGALVVAAVAAFNGANTKYEYGCYTIDGAFSVAMSN
jgi:hypothetical protein